MAERLARPQSSGADQDCGSTTWKLGNFGDCEPVGEGVLELRVHVGPGYPVYCARHARTVVVLLVGGRQVEPTDRYQAVEGIVGRLEAEAAMKKIKASRSHHDAEIGELAANRKLAMEYLKLALQSLHDPNNRAAGLLALRKVAEAYGGLGAVASEAGISRESLYWAF